MARTATDLGYAHPLIGTHVTIRDGALPAGWLEDGTDFLEEWGNAGRGTVADVAQAESGYPFGTVLVHGWYWDWADIESIG